MAASPVKVLVLATETDRDEAAAAPDVAATAPDEAATAPDEAAAAGLVSLGVFDRDLDELRVAEAATAPDEAATAPDEAATAPDEAATAPDEAATAPDEEAATTTDLDLD